MPQREGVLPAEFWSRPDLAAALSTCDMPAVVAAVREARGWSQGELARTVGYSQSWVSRVLNGQQSLTIDQVREIARLLGIPVHLLRFSGTGGRPAATAAPSPRPSGRAGGADPARRRENAKAAAPPVPLPGAAPAGNGIDESTAPALRAITGGQRRLDASSPARDLAAAAVAHLDLSGRTLKRAQRSPFAAPVAAAASEAAGFAAWLHADMGDLGSARTFYRAAIARARQAGDDLLDVYMLGSLAAFEIDADDPALGLGLAQEAGHRLGEGAHPTARAWLSCVRAMAHAGLGDAAAARHAVAAAEADVARPDNAEPPWPWVFAFDDAKVAGYRALTSVKLRDPGSAHAAFSDALGTARPGGKHSAVLMVELASARADSGDIDEAFRLAGDALRTGAAFGSERIIGRVRRFRRRYEGPSARCVSRFDDQLAAVLTGSTPA
ncbi:helix-turn-helix protein [Murinocardiopsis flavida]|uniref:Helix-turn-helix protein n=1 Tax=Murinocardiopsis flavida TaxID=645275 RepID=A0A2P8DLJ9_9ACTN|nr:helix-turn-helix transcriptional regulator [Murinocardiopsis flavida]PSK98078.1 helix-turn-helix protein [Murinocardiopsis flavida]